MNVSPYEIPGRVRVEESAGGWPLLRIGAEAAEAELHLHGAQVTGYRRRGEEPLLFLSGRAEFAEGKAIRGGVPIVFPWFGGREGLPAHGTARTARWELEETAELDDGSVLAALRLPDAGDLSVTYRVTVGRTLRMELSVLNTGAAPATFESCLHTYFAVGDIRRTALRGLRGAEFIDSLTGERHVDGEEEIRVSAETDRLYQGTTAACEIDDEANGRVITVAKSGSRSTVVWNPWVEKSRRMADFGDEEYLRMLCVESGNVADDAVTLAPDECAVLAVELVTRARD